MTLYPGGCLTAPNDPRFPVLTDVRDVPADQGGKVFLTWIASSLDVLGGPVLNYRVWRRVHPQGAPTMFTALSTAEGYLARPAPGTNGTEIEYWEAVATLPAQRLEGYGYTAATTQDSMPRNNPYTAFFVSALTANIDVFYSSNVDSGYSVDNLPPEKPTSLAGAPVGESAFSLTWDEHPAPDFKEFRLYRGVTPNFLPEEGSLLAVGTETEYMDAEAVPYAVYKLAAVDEHENMSELATLERGAPTGVGDEPVLTFGVRSIAPNPTVTGRLTVHFSLPTNEKARLEVIDVQGRRVMLQDVTSLGPGHHSVELGGASRFAPGVYFVLLQQGAKKQEAKAVVLP